MLIMVEATLLLVRGALRFQWVAPRNTTVRRPYMTDERPEIYENGVILEDLEIEELEEVIAPAIILTS